MSVYRWWVVSVVAVLGAAASQGVAAQYYLGAEAGREHLSFKPEYRFVSGAPNRSFDNQADGTVGGVIGGYHWQSAPDFSLDVQGRVSVSNTAWKAELPEPASLRYDLPLAMSVSLQPAFHLSNGFSVFAETGVALGKIHERKTAVTTSMYDVVKWRPGFVAGFGMRLALDARWSLHAGYRRTWYRDHTFNTYRANGTQVETVTSRVVQSTMTMGLVRAF